jgi:hypothetical protein
MKNLKAWAYRLAVMALVAVVAMGLAYSYPADLALLFAVDIATYLEAAVTVWAVAQVTRVKPAWAATRLRMSAIRARIRGRTTVRIQRFLPEKQKLPANDDEGPVAIAA